MQKIKNSILFIFLSIFFIQNANAVTPGSALSACTASIKPPSSLVQILASQIASIYNVLPVHISGIKVLPAIGTSNPSVSKKLFCECNDPFKRIGIPISFWEPHSTIDVSSIPNCVPTLGLSLPLDVVGGQNFQSINKQNKQNNETYQVTYIRNAIMEYLEIFTDVICGNPPNKMDVGYISTIDPIFQNDSWSLSINPDAYLFANPIANFACIADSTMASLSLPIDSLYWCLGSWGQTFPLTKNTIGVTSPEAAMAVASKTLFKLHRQLMLWGSIGVAGLCGEYPMPIMQKNQYQLYPIYPLMNNPIRQPIGRTGLIWGYGLDVPMVNSHVWTIQVYKKKDCCAF